jgi:uncharacterized protein (DUF2062 family)
MAKRRWNLDVLLKGDTRPTVLALSMGIGAFIGCSPAYGFHTLMCLAAVALFRLNPVATLLGSQVSFGPIIVPIMIAEVWIGDLMRFGHVVPLPKLGAAELAKWLLGNALVSWLIGWVVLGGIVGVLTGLLTLGFLRLRRRKPASPPETKEVPR